MVSFPVTFKCGKLINWNLPPPFTCTSISGQNDSLIPYNLCELLKTDWHTVPSYDPRFYIDINIDNDFRVPFLAFDVFTNIL